MAVGGIDVNEVRLAPNGRIYVAAANTAAPTNLATPLSASWTDLGYGSEDGVSLGHTVDLTEIKAWQTGAVVKRGIDSIGLEIKFSLMQTNKESTALYFAGSTWANGASGVATLTVPSNPTISSMEHALCIEWTDDSGDIQRLYSGRGIVSDREEIKLTRTDAVMYGVTYVAFDNNGELARILSNSDDLYSS